MYFYIEVIASSIQNKPSIVISSICYAFMVISWVFIRSNTSFSPYLSDSSSEYLFVILFHIRVVRYNHVSCTNMLGFIEAILPPHTPLQPFGYFGNLGSIPSIKFRALGSLELSSPLQIMYYSSSIIHWINPTY